MDNIVEAVAEALFRGVPLETIVTRLIEHGRNQQTQENRAVSSIATVAWCEALYKLEDRREQ